MSKPWIYADVNTMRLPSTITTENLTPTQQKLGALLHNLEEEHEKGREESRELKYGLDISTTTISDDSLSTVSSE